MDAHIIIIDNDDHTRDALASSLKSEGWQVFGQTYAHVDLALLEQHHPDLMILDFNPTDVGTGWELLQLLKMNDQTAKIPVIITTAAFQLPVEIRNYLLSRFISVVSKPLDLISFVKLVENTLKLASRAGELFLGDRTLPILVVDDSDDLRDVTTTVLRMEGYRVVTAYNGQVALDTVSQADYCLILLDLSMPIMNGHEFLSAYQRQLRPHSPVIILSAEKYIETQDFPYFVVGVVPKPFHIAYLLRFVEKYAQPV